MHKLFICRHIILALGVSILFAACVLPKAERSLENRQLPLAYKGSAFQDSVNAARTQWRKYFSDPYLISLIDTALRHNQELQIALQEIEIARSEIRAKKGEYLPSISIGAGAGLEKPARYTNTGAAEANIDIKPGVATPDPLSDYKIGLGAQWEIDIWKKLRNAKKAAVSRFLATVEGKNFMVTRLIAEIAQAYYELLSLDNQLSILQQNIKIQTDALEVVRLEKQSAKTTELAVKRFEAQVLKTKGLQYGVQQKIVETENRINFLVGRLPQPIARDGSIFNTLIPQTAQAGIPSDLLNNRPDIKKAEFDLAAARLDVKSARARFYPSLSIMAGVGFRAFNPSFLFVAPESLLYSVAGELAAPLINRNAIKANYLSANAKQVQSIYSYEQTILNAYVEVENYLSKIQNLQKSYEMKTQEVDALMRSIAISNDLFKSARADYMEVLLTQRDALESRFDLVELRMQQMATYIHIYRSLGGGWN